LAPSRKSFTFNDDAGWREIPASIGLCLGHASKFEGAWPSRSWGKHFLIELPGCALRIHFLMFGICRIEECWNSLLRSFTLAQSILKPNIRYRKS
jgi:hypothetical protein